MNRAEAIYSACTAWDQANGHPDDWYVAFVKALRAAGYAVVPLSEGLGARRDIVQLPDGKLQCMACENIAEPGVEGGT